MDYVIAGLGSGAVLAIIGFLLRELGLSRRTSFPRWMAPAGVALMFAALIIWVVTAAAFFSSMDDDSALPVVAGSAVVATLGSLAAATVMIRTHKPRPVPAFAGAPALGDGAAASAMALVSVDSAPLAEVSKDTELAPTDLASTEVDTDVPAEPDAEKNWPEIWRQTWGGDAGPELVAVAGEVSDSLADPVDEAVLESSGALPDREPEVEPDLQEEKAADTDSAPESAQFADDHPIEHTAGDSGTEHSAQLAMSDTREVDAEPDAPAASTEDSDPASAGDRSQNGNEPKANLEEPETAADLASSRYDGREPS